jgi:hypothetical protein
MSTSPSPRRFAWFFACLLALGAVAPSEGEARPRPVRIAQNAAPAKPSSTRSLIDRAREMFDDQAYEESIQTLSGALVRPGTSKTDRVEVYKLLAFNYITLGKTEEADAAVRALLVLDETYELPSSESPRFRDFFKKTRATWEAEGKPGTEASGTPVVEAKPVKLVHTPMAQVAPGTPIAIEGKVDDPGGRIARVDIAYRAGAKGKFTTKPLVFSMGAFRGQIPASIVSPPLVEYYLLAYDAEGLPVGARGDADAPLRVAVPTEDDGGVLTSPWFWIPVGAVVVGGAILTAVVASSGGGTGGSGGGGGTSNSTVTINVGE